MNIRRNSAGRILAVGLDLGNTLMQYDGVPLNWREHYPAALREVCLRLRLEPDEKRLHAACERLCRYNTRQYPREVESSAEAIFSDVLGCFGDVSSEAVGTAVDAFFAYFRQNYRVYEDALPFLGALKSAGIPAGILTDVPYGMPRRWVEHDVAPFRPFVSSVLSSVDVGFRKPNTSGFLALARALGAEPGRMVFIGDEEKDITGAKYAGMTAVLIDRNGTRPFFGEDFRISNLMELL